MNLGQKYKYKLVVVKSRGNVLKPVKFGTLDAECFFLIQLHTPILFESIALPVFIPLCPRSA